MPDRRIAPPAGSCRALLPGAQSRFVTVRRWGEVLRHQALPLFPPASCVAIPNESEPSSQSLLSSKFSWLEPAEAAADRGHSTGGAWNWHPFAVGHSPAEDTPRSFSGRLAAPLLGNRPGPILDFRVVRTAAWAIAHAAARTPWQSSDSQSSDAAN